MRQTLTITSKEGILITLSILKCNDSDTGLWNIDNNTILLGRNQWEEFQDMWGNIQRQAKFLQGLTKISNSLIG